MSNKVLRFDGVTKIIDKKKIVSNVTFKIDKGSIVGLLGPNGAGKTTIMKLILGLSKINSGKIFINSIDVSKSTIKALLNVGAMIESPIMYGNLTGYKNLLHYARMYDNVTNARITEITTLLNMDEYINIKVKKYSLGMKQKLGIAQALLNNSQVLILDEPFNGLDPMGVNELKKYFKDIVSKDSKSILISSHSLLEMENLCNKVVILKEGKNICEMDIKELKNSYSDKILEIDGEPLEKMLFILNNNYNIIPKKIEDNKIEFSSLGVDTSKLLINFLSNDIKINSFNKKLKSLEDIFIELTKGV